MSGDTPGANPADARRKGGDGTSVADTFVGLVTAFETAAETLDEKVAEKNIKGAFSEFYLEHKKSVQDVERHGMTMTHNIQAGATKVASTDADATLRYQRVDGFQHTRPTPETDPESTEGSLLNRYVNGQTDRYTP